MRKKENARKKKTKKRKKAENQKTTEENVKELTEVLEGTGDGAETEELWKKIRERGKTDRKETKTTEEEEEEEEKTKGGKVRAHQGFHERNFVSWQK